MEIPNLIRELTQLSNTYYGGGTNMKIPFMGGFIELDLEFDNGMINVKSATCFDLGEETPIRSRRAILMRFSWPIKSKKLYFCA